MRRRRSDRSAPPRPWWSDRRRSRREWRQSPFSYGDLRFLQSEPGHLTDDPLDVGFVRPEARDAGAHDRRAAAEANLGHPGDLALVELGEKPAGDQALAREAHDRQRRVVDDTPPVTRDSPAQQVAHARLVLDHLDIAGLAALGERNEQ